MVRNDSSNSTRVLIVNYENFLDYGAAFFRVVDASTTITDLFAKRAFISVQNPTCLQVQLSTYIHQIWTQFSKKLLKFEIISILEFLNTMGD